MRWRVFDYDTAMEEARVAERFEPIVMLSLGFCYFRFVESLVLLSRWGETSGMRRRKMLKRVRALLSHMLRWKDRNLELHLSKAVFLRAEIAAINKQGEVRCYQRARHFHVKSHFWWSMSADNSKMLCYGEGPKGRKRCEIRSHESWVTRHRSSFCVETNCSSRTRTRRTGKRDLNL